MRPKAKGEKWPGLPDRLREAFEQAGYWNKDGDKPDVLRFSLEHRFVYGYLFKYLHGDAVPTRDNLYRLAEALNVSPAWLLFGGKRRRAVHPIGGGSDAVAPHPLPSVADVIPLIRHVLRKLWEMTLGCVPIGLSYGPVAA